MTQRELVDAVQRQIATLVPSGRLRGLPPKTGFNKQDLEHLEANRSYLPLAKCLALALVLEIDWDEFLRTLIATYAPQLLAKSPGTPGERIYWARKRKLWTIEDLEEISGLRTDQIYPFELNRKNLSVENLRCLEKVLGYTEAS